MSQGLILISSEAIIVTVAEIIAKLELVGLFGATTGDPALVAATVLSTEILNSLKSNHGL